MREPGSAASTIGECADGGACCRLRSLVPITMFARYPAFAVALILGGMVCADFSEQTYADGDSLLCALYSSLSPQHRNAVGHSLAEHCGDQARMAKRKPNFIRFGRSGADSTRPNFLRFGRSAPNFLRFGRPDVPNFLRFGRAGAPNFLRFGRSMDSDEFERHDRKPNFIRFGRSVANDADLSPNFLRFGRPVDADDFGRPVREPGSLRYVR